VNGDEHELWKPPAGETRTRVKSVCLESRKTDLTPLGSAGVAVVQERAVPASIRAAQSVRRLTGSASASDPMLATSCAIRARSNAQKWTALDFSGQLKNRLAREKTVFPR
jgi:hypothetical protein